MKLDTRLVSSLSEEHRGMSSELLDLTYHYYNPFFARGRTPSPSNMDVRHLSLHTP